MTNETVRIYRRRATQGQIVDVVTTLGQACPSEFTFEEAEYIIGHKGPFFAAIRKAIAEFCPPRTFDLPQLKFNWELFYKAQFGIDYNFSSLEIPKQEEGFDLLLIIAKGLTAQRVYEVCEKNFPCTDYTDHGLDDGVIKNERSADKGAYAIWVRDCVEADLRLKKLSADELTEAELKTETLTERLLHELVYYKQSGLHRHLDDLGYSMTLCAGTRHRDNERTTVPCVAWVAGSLCIYSSSSDMPSADFSAREVCS